MVGESEQQLLRRIDDVVRMGHVQKIEKDAIILDDGRLPTSTATVQVQCAARGLARRPLRPIFEPGQVTVQPFLWAVTCFPFAMLGVLDATIERDEEKNRLCRPLEHWDENTDYLSAFLATLVHSRTRASHPAVASWAKTTRLNPLSEIALPRDDPTVKVAHESISRFGAAATKN